MINNELLTFIKERVAQGSTHEQITDMLVTHGGWDQSDVEEAFDTVSIAGSSMSQAVGSFAKPADTNIVSPVISEVKKEPEEKPITIASSPETAPSPVSSPVTFMDHSFSAEAVNDVLPISQPINILPTQSFPTTDSSVPEIKIVEPIMPPTQTLEAQTFQEPTVPPPSFSPKVTAPLGFSTFSKLQEQKTLEPSGQAPFASSRLGTFQIKPLNSMGSVAGGASAVNEKPSTPPQTMGFKTQGSDLSSLKSIREEFATGKPATSIPMTKSATGFITFPETKEQASAEESNPISNPNIFGTKNFNLSPHLQSGMMPSNESIGTNIRVSTAPAPTFTPVQKPFNPGTIGQKTPMVAPIFTPQMQVQTALKPMPQSKAGRKLFGTIVFLIGLVVGATGMHAYLSGYFNPAIDWVKTTVPGMSGLNIDA